MELDLMTLTAWTFVVIGAIGFFRYKGETEAWGKRFYAGMTVVALIQVLVLTEVLRVGFLDRTLVLPAVLLFCTLVCLFGVEEKVFSSVAFYSSVLQLLVYFGVLTDV